MVDEFVVRKGLRVGSLMYPITDGTAGQVVTTDGAGHLTLQNSATSGLKTISVRVNLDSSGNFLTSGTIFQDVVGVGFTTSNFASLSGSAFTFTHSLGKIPIMVSGTAKQVDGTFILRSVDGAAGTGYRAVTASSMNSINIEGFTTSNGSGQANQYVIYKFVFEV